MRVTDPFAGKAQWFDDHYATTRGRIRLELVLERLTIRLPPPPARLLDAGGGTGVFAVRLALAGYEVTLLDASEEWLRQAQANADAADVRLTLVKGNVEAPPAGLSHFDGILCHAVLMYVDEPAVALRALRSAARRGAVLSLLEKNRDALALRPGLAGDYREAERLLTARDAAGRLGITNRAYTIEEWQQMLGAASWLVKDWAGVRLFSDAAADDLDADAYRALFDLERAAGTLEPYRSVSRLVHFVARAA